MFNIFQTPDGVKSLKSSGYLNLDQRYSFASGVIKREIGFDSYHLAENLVTSTIFQVFNSIKSQNTTLSFDTESQFTTTPKMSPDSDPSSVSISLEMNVPKQQKLRVKLPVLEQIKLAWIQYISFVLIFVALMHLVYKLV